MQRLLYGSASLKEAHADTSAAADEGAAGSKTNMMGGQGD